MLLSKPNLLFSLFVLCAILLSLAAETPQADAPPSMVDLLEVGQIVGVSDKEFGFQLRIYAASQIELAIEGIEQRRKQLDKHLKGKPQAEKLIDDRPSSKQYFESKHPEVAAIHRDHIVLQYPSGREQRIAIGAVVEINRYSG